MHTEWLENILENNPSLSVVDEDLMSYIMEGDDCVGVYDYANAYGFVDLSEDIMNEARQVWAKRGNTLVRKFRCISGGRKGRVVSSPKQCNAPVNIKKRMNFKKTRAKLGGKMSRKASRTKRINPTSLKLKKLNRR